MTSASVAALKGARAGRVRRCHTVLYTSMYMYDRRMSTKTKRTCNISQDAVATVRRLVEEEHVAPSQDALVEQAINDLARRIQDAADARLWEVAAADDDFGAESNQPRYPSEVAVPVGEAGGPKPGVILVHQVRTIFLERAMRNRRIPQGYVLDPGIRGEVRRALERHLGLDYPPALDGAL